MPNEKNIQKSIAVTIYLHEDMNERLRDVAKIAGRSKGVEATLRLTQHLKSIPRLTESYWEILSEEKKP